MQGMTLHMNHAISVFPQCAIKPDFVVVTHEPTPAIFMVFLCPHPDPDVDIILQTLLFRP
jgi:hypothetical protein